MSHYLGHGTTPGSNSKNRINQSASGHYMTSSHSHHRRQTPEEIADALVDTLRDCLERAREVCKVDFAALPLCSMSAELGLEIAYRR